MLYKSQLPRKNYFLQLAGRDGSARYVKNQLYSKRRQNPRYIRVLYTPSNFTSLHPGNNAMHLPVKVNIEGVCNLCEDLCYFDVVSLEYAQHMAIFHEVSVPRETEVQIELGKYCSGDNLPRVECRLYSQFLREKKPPSGLRNQYHKLDLSGLDKTVVFRTKPRMQEFIELVELEDDKEIPEGPFQGLYHGHTVFIF